MIGKDESLLRKQLFRLDQSIAIWKVIRKLKREGAYEDRHYRERWWRLKDLAIETIGETHKFNCPLCSSFHPSLCTECPWPHYPRMANYTRCENNMISAYNKYKQTLKTTPVIRLLRRQRRKVLKALEAFND